MPLVKKGPLKRHKWPTEELQKAAKVIIDKDTKKPKKIKSKGKVKGKSKSKVKSKSKDKSNDKVAAETEGNAEVVVASSASRVERGSGDGPHQPRSQPSLVALHFSDISLRHSDVQLLQSHSEGLNERLVAFYFAYLQHRQLQTPWTLVLTVGFPAGWKILSFRFSGQFPYQAGGFNGGNFASTPRCLGLCGSHRPLSSATSPDIW
nr:uncharacterized protein LOC108133459 isoform X2 [Drosophila bipectinata]